MIQSVSSTDPTIRVHLQHPAQQVKAHVVNPLHKVPQVLPRELVKVPVVVRQLADPGPGLFTGGSHDPKDLFQLVVVRSPLEERSPVVEFSENAPDAPDVNTCVVVPAAHQDVRRTVPEGDDLVRVAPDRDSEGTGQAEVSEFQ